jgi:hypothetical protein
MARTREPFHFLNNDGIAICMSPERKGSSDAWKVLKASEACFRCESIVRKVRRDLVWRLERG